MNRSGNPMIRSIRPASSSSRASTQSRAVPTGIDAGHQRAVDHHLRGVRCPRDAIQQVIHGGGIEGAPHLDLGAG
jgi:hypothetical protein